MTKPIKCPYCNEDIEDDDEYNEHLITKHPEEFDDMGELNE